MSPQEVAFKLIQCLCIQPMTEISTAVVWVWSLLISETSWLGSIDAEIVQSPHAGGQASSSWYVVQSFRVGIVLKV